MPDQPDPAGVWELQPRGGLVRGGRGGGQDQPGSGLQHWAPAPRLQGPSLPARQAPSPVPADNKIQAQFSRGNELSNPKQAALINTP